MITKLNHYVPRFYLARFTAPDGLLWVFDKETRSSRRQAPQNTGAESHLYTVEKEDGEKSDRIEREIMSPMDGSVAPILDRWAQRGYRFVGKELPVVAQYMAIQHSRVPRNLELINEFGVAFFLKDLKELADDPQRFSEIFEFMSKNHGDLISGKEELKSCLKKLAERAPVRMNPKLALCYSLLMARDFCRVLSRMYWSIVECPDGCEFITCDSPVVSCAEDDSGRAQFAANFVSPRFEVAFPISPSMCVYIRRRQGQYRYRCGRALVQKLNRRAACMAERFVYARNGANVGSIVEQFSYTRHQPKVNRQELYDSMDWSHRQRMPSHPPIV
jgi:hypothetical protein